MEPFSSEKPRIQQSSLDSLAQAIIRLQPGETKTRLLPESIRTAYLQDHTSINETLFAQDLREYTQMKARKEHAGLFFDPRNDNELMITVIDNETVQFQRLSGKKDLLERAFEATFGSKRR